jgi:outer membrane receptor protein involved in Fe transport
VFHDGVRINEPFGDVVNWDLIPAAAIASIQLIPGSNPAFGLNTLGGALAIYTRSGAQNPGGAVEVSAGSFRRVSAGFEYGGARDRIDYFVTGNVFDDKGWAHHNPSRVKQLFGKVGYQDDKLDFDVSLTLADNNLQGAQTLPVSWLDTPRQAYTFPDRNENKLTFLTAKGSRFLGQDVLLGGNAYYRRFRNTNVSSNVNDDYRAIDPDTGMPVLNQATNDRSAIDQRSWGFGLQLTVLGGLAGRRNQFIAGLGGDFGDTTFAQATQAANFTVDRAAVGIGPFAPDTDVGTANRYVGVYFNDTLMLHEHWTLTLSGRYNHARIVIDDRSGTHPALNGDFAFSRFNPALGINFNPLPALTAYTSYSQGMRAPSPVELSCADAAAPCKLPNIFIADPPLKKVVSKTIEAGARGKLDATAQWAIAAYRTDLDDDIQFISSGAGAVNTGYFQNVGKTRRQGIELWGGTRVGALSLNLRYSHTDATFRSAFVAASPDNSAADQNGAITVTPGNRIPGIPSDSAKLRLDYDFDERFSIGGSVVYASSQYARGDENNQDRHGKVPAYTVVDLDARYRAAKDLEVFARIANAFDRRYQNIGVLGSNAFTGPNRSFGPASGNDAVAEQFRGIGAPRGIWIGLRYSFAAPAPGN